MKVKKFQAGGVTPTDSQEVVQPAQDPVLEMAQLFAQGLQNGDCNMLAQGAELFLSMLQQVQAPAQEPLGQPSNSEPVFKKGGKIVRRKKCSK